MFPVYPVEVLVEVLLALWDLLDFEITFEESLKFCSVYLPILLQVGVVEELLQGEQVGGSCLLKS